MDFADARYFSPISHDEPSSPTPDRVGCSRRVFMGQTKKRNEKMKAMKLTLVAGLLCAAALLASTGLVRAEDKKPCCAPTVEAGLKCEHECCVKAAKDGKVCEKCHPKEDKK
jgi:hypothetical protein